MTRTQDHREKKAQRIPASITISQTESPTSAVKQLDILKKSSSIVDIRQESFQLQFPDAKFRDRNKSNSVLPTRMDASKI